MPKKNGKKKKRSRRQPKLRYEALTELSPIRLLQLEPASKHDAPLRASLLHTSFTSSEYEALSYAWGDPIFDRSIDVSGCSLKITKSLDMALRVFRHTTDVRAIWVDAVCINQQDDQEKGKQVAIMGRIFQDAIRVLVWLGPGTSKTAEAIEFLPELSSDAARFGVSNEVGKGRLHCKMPTAAVSAQEIDLIIAKAYATEVEPLLEVMVHCGSNSLSWVDFARGVEVLVASIYKASYSETGSSNETMHSKAATVRDLVNARDMLVMMRRPVHRYNTHLPKIVASSQMSFRQCKDDRDRVYGMLALVRSDQPIVPDYSKTIAQVYTEFATLTPLESSLFNAGLCYRGVSSLAKLISDRHYLPSWVTDLRPSKPKWRPIFNTGFTTSALDNRIYGVDPCYPTVLSITGAHFDTINKQYGTKTQPKCDSSIDYMEVIKVMRMLIAELVIHRRGEAGSEFPEEVFQILTIKHPDHKLSQLFYSVSRFLDESEFQDDSWILEVWRVYLRVCLDSDGEVFQKALIGGNVETVSREGRLGLRIHHYLCDLFSNHNVFTTTRGYLGLSPRESKNGDEVAVFNGCPTPFVIRDAGNVFYENKAVNNAFYILGPCYVYGIMDQEIYKRQHDSEFNHLPWLRRPDHPFGDILGETIVLV
ncbi:unnamed protein product [Clonostachys rosea]|uniref:Heterokaryon incompatibility domain-containing protein n=1 Tax=Bionectria ochroleuca TaxID=29856 RepID=A0ABY6UCB0_BIOOC|nr:unnamed protein product [Clonostachys rosea]